MNRLALAAIAAISLAVGGVLLVTERTAYAATITVDSLNDTIADDDECTLREAIENANDTVDGQPHDDCDAGNPAGEDLIAFDVTGMIVLSSELPQVDGDLVIDGGDDIEIDAASSTRIITLGDAALTLQAITLRNGQTDEAGAAVLSASGGTLTVVDSSFIANNAPGGGASSETGMGGAIAVLDGSLEVSGSTFAENGAESHGGAIYVAGPAEISDTRFDDNASSAGNGGAIAMDSPNEPDRLTLEAVTFTSNRTALDGGATYAANHTDASEVQAEDNEAEGNGGALFFTAVTVDLVDSSFRLNAAGQGGGAIYLDGGFIDIEGTTFEENGAVDNGGAIHSEGASGEVLESVFQDNAANIDGGAIFNNGPLFVDLSTFDGNTAVGNGGAIAIANHDEPGIELKIDRSTIIDNSATNGGGIFFGAEAEGEMFWSTVSANEASEDGAGLYIEGTYAIWNSTITANVATGDGGGLLNAGVLSLVHVTLYSNSADDGGAVRTLEDSETEFINSVVAASGEVANCSFDEDPTGVDESNISDDDSCGEPLFVEVDDVELGPLADNGGPTFTHLPAETSPLVNAANADECADDDQRGEERPAGDECDIGSVELQDLTPTPTPEPLGDLFVPQIARDVEHD